MLGRDSFPSKILLFGEYTIIRNSNALAVPFELFSSLVFPKKTPSMDKIIRTESFCFLEISKNIDLPFDECSIDTDSFSFDVSQGLTFESSIPQGYGVGSSGALLSDFSALRASADEILMTQKMKKIFSSIENHFHGESSGLDPLISFYPNQFY